MPNPSLHRMRLRRIGESALGQIRAEPAPAYFAKPRRSIRCGALASHSSDGTRGSGRLHSMAARAEPNTSRHAVDRSRWVWRGPWDGVGQASIVKSCSPNRVTGRIALPAPTPPSKRGRAGRFLAVLAEGAALLLCHGDRCPVAFTAPAAPLPRLGSGPCKVGALPPCRAGAAG
jgi:hypothetical protein